MVSVRTPFFVHTELEIGGDTSGCCECPKEQRVETRAERAAAASAFVAS
jgi:hypothetical protein